MATRHTLALDVIETAVPQNMLIADLSTYAPKLKVDNPRLDIWLPGFAEPVYISGMQPNFLRKVNAIDLGLQDATDPAVVSLPDGLYKIRFSVSPNDTVSIEYYHLRTVLLSAEYYRELARIRLDSGEPDPARHERLHELRYIKLCIDGAKAKAEYAHAPVEAMKLYVYAEKLLKKYRSTGCPTC
jgi:hypothetical protein